MTISQRRSAVAAQFDKAGVDGLLVVRDIHVRYLTGLMSSNSSAFLTSNSIDLYSDGRYALMAKHVAPDSDFHDERNVLEAAIKTASQRGIACLGFESAYINVAQIESLESLAATHGVRLVPLTNLVEDQRLLKDDQEISDVTSACHITDRAWEQTIEDGVVGKTEREIAGIVEMYFRKFGAEDRAFESIVATGPNSAIPHHHPTDRVVVAGDLLKIDCGAKFNGYHADMTRTVVVGKAAEWQREIYAHVAHSQQSAMDACKPGVDVRYINDVAHGVVAEAGYGETLVHKCGHGVGLEIHERPFLGSGDGILQPRMPITVEPGIYLENRGGVRIEDTILIVESGYRRLTESNRELREV
ncbi:MAG: hypothetical protein RL410_880 [Actinomycetota bacterium]